MRQTLEAHLKLQQILRRHGQVFWSASPGQIVELQQIQRLQGIQEHVFITLLQVAGRGKCYHSQLEDCIESRLIESHSVSHVHQLTVQQFL